MIESDELRKETVGRRYKLVWLLTIVLAFTSLVQGQSQWEQSSITDPLHKTSYLQFKLKGKFLTPPRNGSNQIPELVLHCAPGSYSHGKAHGKLIDGFITVGTVLNSRPSQGSSLSRVNVVLDVELRLDEKKLQNEIWGVSTDRTAVYVSTPLCGDCALNNLFYGHSLPHKEGTGEQIRKVLIGVYEYLAAEVVMEFDLPDVSQVGDACGVIWHK